MEKRKPTVQEEKKSTVGETAARMAYEGGQSQFREGHLVGMLLAGSWLDSDPELKN